MLSLGMTQFLEMAITHVELDLLRITGLWLKGFAVSFARTKAKGKAWFGVLDCFAALDYDWSILEDVLKIVTKTHPLQEV